MNEHLPQMESLAVSLFRTSGIEMGDYSISALQGGNNRVYLLDTKSDRYVLKHYYDSAKDKRDRLNSEYEFLKFAWENGICEIPKPLACNPDKRIALYQYIEGHKLVSGQVTYQHVSMAAEFISELNTKENRLLPEACNLPMAADFYSNIRQAVLSVDSRMQKLLSISIKDAIDRKANTFIETFLAPEWQRIKTKLSEFGSNLNGIDESELILSPSDFGFHNAIINENGRVIFIDFEYAGWDDPVKLVCDFFCQPAVPVPINFLDRFTDNIIMLIDTQRDIKLAIEMLFPLFRIKWCCIMLNDFLPSESRRKAFANFKDDTRKSQLEKAQRYAEENL